VVSLRMVYTTDDQLSKYKEAIGSGDNLVTQLITDSKEQFEQSGTPYLALVVRGPQASLKVERIVGGSNPDIGRNMREKSMRAFYGKDKQHNCVFNVHGGVKKRRSLLDLIFWTGGRVMQEQESHDVDE